MSDGPTVIVEGLPIDPDAWKDDEGTQVAVRYLPVAEFVPFSEALVGALRRDGRMWQVSIAHDEDCPACDENVMLNCTCEFVDAVFWRAPEGRPT